MIECPYCERGVEGTANLCPHCDRDLSVVKPLLGKIARMEARLLALSDEQGRLRQAMALPSIGAATANVGEVAEEVRGGPEGLERRKGRRKRKRERWAERMEEAIFHDKFLVVLFSIGLLIVGVVFAHFVHFVNGDLVTALAISATLPCCIWLGCRSRGASIPYFVTLGLNIGVIQGIVLWILQRLHIVTNQYGVIFYLGLLLASTLEAVAGGVFGHWMRRK